LTAPATDLFAQQEANRKASRRLVIGFILFFAWLGFGGDFVWYVATSNAGAGAHLFPGVGLTLLLISGGMVWWSMTVGPTQLVRSTGARHIETPATDAERQLVNVVEEMAIAAGTPVPEVWIVPDPVPNAFATGLDQNRSRIAVTEGLLTTCTREELQAVIAHEMGHIVNLDVRLMTLLTAIVGSIVIINNVFLRSTMYGGRSSRSRDNDRGGANPLALALLALWIISWILAPIVTRVIAMKVGRSREFLADAMSAQFTRNPAALASALDKLDRAPNSEVIPVTTANLCIDDPHHSDWNDKRGWLANLLATHPPTIERIKRLEAMGYAGGPGTPPTSVT
jgi:heat shock protein HtpX